MKQRAPGAVFQGCRGYGQSEREEENIPGKDKFPGDAEV